MTDLQPGDLVQVRALHSDGQAYRWWQTTVESAHDDRIVTVSPVGRSIDTPDGRWMSKVAARSCYWLARPYVVSEFYRPPGDLDMVYVHIASPTTLEDHQMTYTDLELDVVLRPGQAPEVVDEDEFAEAALHYGYSAEFQAACQRAVAEAIELVLAWEPAGLRW